MRAVNRGADAFTARVLAVVRRIPPGRVSTYGDVAELAGRPRAARAVGNIMKGCGRPDVPCHRVIAAGGRLGGYGGNEVLKRSLLVAEGLVVSGSRVRELERVRWTRGSIGRSGAGSPGRARAGSRSGRNRRK
jgi:O-6-methylguanine DNA methyltransferase